MNFADLLKLHDFNPKDVRLVRHPANRVFQKFDVGKTTLYSLWRNSKDLWDHEIRVQSKKTFGRQKYVAHFIGLASGDTVFTGLYELIDFTFIKESADGRYEFINPPANENDSLAIWNHRKIEVFEQYEERLIINWNATRSWSQIASNTPKLILAIEKTYREPDFPGFDSFSMMSNRRSELPESWKAVLSATKGIYLLIHHETGDQYVGSAYGEDGFYGRWANYEDEMNGHGGNKLLKDLESTIFRISIIETTPSSFAAEEIIKRESVWKEKLGSRVFGLNAN